MFPLTDYLEPLYFNFSVERDGKIIEKSKLSREEVEQRCKNIKFKQEGQSYDHIFWISEDGIERIIVSAGIRLSSFLRYNNNNYETPQNPKEIWNVARDFLKLSKEFPLDSVREIIQMNHYRQTVALAAIRENGEEKYLTEKRKTVISKKP